MDKDVGRSDSRLLRSFVSRGTHAHALFQSSSPLEVFRIESVAEVAESSYGKSIPSRWIFAFREKIV